MGGQPRLLKVGLVLASGLYMDSFSSCRLSYNNRRFKKRNTFGFEEMDESFTGNQKRKESKQISADGHELL